MIHPDDENMAWLLHARRVPLLRDSRKATGSGEAQPSGDSAAQPSLPYHCSGVGDPDAHAWICHDCATCLCVEEALIKMPEYALANKLFLGRLHPLLQKHGTLGLRMLLCLGRPCFRKLVLGKGLTEDRQVGLQGNHVLLSQPAADLGKVLPLTSQNLNFVALFGPSHNDLSKCQILRVHREAYSTLVRERARENPTYHDAHIDEDAVAAFPEYGVPKQIMECGCPLPGIEKYQATREGPGSIRDPMDATKDQDDAEEEDISDNEHEEGTACGAEQPEDGTSKSASEYLNQYETPLGLDATASPSQVQLLAAFQTGVSLAKESFLAMSRLQERERNDSQNAVSRATAMAGAEEQCYRRVVDLLTAKMVLLMLMLMIGND